MIFWGHPVELTMLQLKLDHRNSGVNISLVFKYTKTEMGPHRSLFKQKQRVVHTSGDHKQVSHATPHKCVG